MKKLAYSFKYGAVIGVVAAVSLVKLWVPGIGDEAPALLYLMGIFLVANFGSFRAALLAAALSALAMNVLFSAPRFGLSTETLAVVKAVILLIEGMFITWLAYRAKEAHRRLVAVQVRLEESNRRLTNLMLEILEKENGTYLRSVRKSGREDASGGSQAPGPQSVPGVSPEMVAGATSTPVPAPPLTQRERDIMGTKKHVEPRGKAGQR